MNVFSLTDFGGRGDNLFDNTSAFKQAFAAIHDAGGGTLKVTKGVWLTGPMELFSHTTVYLEQDAVICFIPEPARYTPVHTRWEGIECYGMHPLVFATGQTDITIAGKGVFDGSGSPWWESRRQKKNFGAKRSPNS
jgi:polygalacturonase